MTNVSITASCKGDAVTVRTVYLNPRARAKLPFTASNGVLFAVVAASGRPAASLTIRGKPTIFLRGDNCPLVNWNDSPVIRTDEPGKLVADLRKAVSEFRRATQGASVP